MPYIYTDGACSGNGYHGAKAGVGVWFGPNHPDNISRPVFGSPTNQRAELEAIADALNAIAPQNPRNKHDQIVICTDSSYAIQALQKWIPQWKRNGWKTARGQGVKHKELFQQITDRLALLTAEHVNISFQKVKGHSGNEGNDGADKLAKQGAVQYTPESPSTQKMKQINFQSNMRPRLLRLGSKTWVRVNSEGVYRECVK